jgi:tyrosyl-tRNA synthetase
MTQKMKYRSEFLNILDQRGFIHQCSDFEGLDAKLCEGVQSAYVGYDATAPSLHVGSLISIMMLYWFQQCGHKPITLMGGGTTKVGDPSGKDESRKMLDDAAINENIAGIRKVFEKFIRYGDGKTDAVMVNNNDWLSGINYIDFLRDYGPHFTINRMMTFDSVKTRLEREQPLTFLEFNYMILQAYDFVELRKRFGTVLQMGGSDQWGNIINGVELWRKKSVERAHENNRKKIEEKRKEEGSDKILSSISRVAEQIFGLTCPLLTTSSGAKMGKTAAGAVWLNMEYLSPYDYFQFWRNTEDSDVVRFLKLFTTLPLDEIARLEKGHINDAKKVLAFEATKLCHGEDNAISARDTAQKVFEQGGVGGDLPSIKVDTARLEAGIAVIDLLVEAGLAASKGEARRLVQGGGIKCNDALVNDPTAKIVTNDLGGEGYIKLSAGKKKHALVHTGK